MSPIDSKRPSLNKGMTLDMDMLGSRHSLTKASRENDSTQNLDLLELEEMSFLTKKSVRVRKKGKMTSPSSRQRKDSDFIKVSNMRHSSLKQQDTTELVKMS